MSPRSRISSLLAIRMRLLVKIKTVFRRCIYLWGYEDIMYVGKYKRSYFRVGNTFLCSASESCRSFSRWTLSSINSGKVCVYLLESSNLLRQFRNRASSFLVLDKSSLIWQKENIGELKYFDFFRFIYLFFTFVKKKLLVLCRLYLFVVASFIFGRLSS